MNDTCCNKSSVIYSTRLPVFFWGVIGGPGLVAATVVAVPMLPLGQRNASYPTCSNLNPQTCALPPDAIIYPISIGQHTCVGHATVMRQATSCRMVGAR